MSATINIHRQFARFFKDPKVEPYLFELSRMLTEGHICIDPLSIDQEALKEAGYEGVPAPDVMDRSALISNGEGRTPFVYAHNRLYMQRYYFYETRILERIQEFSDYERDKRKIRLTELAGLKDVVEQLFTGSSSIEGKVDWQWLAALTTVLHDFSIITGGPGTGKTTTVAKVLRLLLHMNKDLRIALCAPTGKAAARMAESLRRAATDSAPFIKEAFQALAPATIHRLLGTMAGSPNFKHNRDQPLEADVVIVDEASMIDVALMAKLMDAIGEGTKLILLGDKDQLSSVEAGSLFGDLCNALPALNEFSEAFLDEVKALLPPGSILPNEYMGDNKEHLLFEHIVELQHSHRFSDSDGIGKFSKAVLRNQPEQLEGFFGNYDPQVIIDPAYDGGVFEQFVLGYREFLEEPDIQIALRKINRLRVLCAIRDTALGVEAVNRRIENILKKRAGLKPHEAFYQNRPVMVTGNNRQLNLFNGDIGIIRADEAGVMRAWFEAADGTVRSVLPGFIGSLETAFAMTIHKSQGSEFNKVLVLLPEKAQAAKILTRELLYTAVTRAREQVVIQGSHSVMLEAAAIGIHRGSGVIQRLQKHT
ncbi:exodeoxyribonuclease V subunit alpha [Arachidicoccus terrestris]|uniref:exodeoxyribonuclease V subunit alpha n=1 Tax=Arachidicoccus terrestris TaxID=2875539 RepID=UPI001CC647D2|nr:exodeoxyribonuclease V subunit alpha [Arachidicoccus terrestris]UAY55932.1 exodeoxyribonuclease V subunit alpha [Arachidicoccus terrestris]